MDDRVSALAKGGLLYVSLDMQSELSAVKSGGLIESKVVDILVRCIIACPELHRRSALQNQREQLA